MSRNIQHKHKGNLPSVDSSGPAVVPRNFTSRAMLDAATAALRRRGIARHPWNHRTTKKP